MHWQLSLVVLFASKTMARLTKHIDLSEAEKAELLSIVKKGTHKSRKIIRARALLSMGEKKEKQGVLEEVGIGPEQYRMIKNRYFSGGLKEALEEKPRSGQPPKVNEKIEAQITAIACSEAPEGYARWTLSLIKDKLVELKCEKELSKECIRTVLKKANLSLG
jgi:putative transposase